MKRMKIRHRGMLVFVLLLSASFLAGCGAENAAQNAGTPIRAASSAADAGIKVCATCHNAETSRWMLSMHGNAVDSDKYGGLDSGLLPDLGAGGSPPYNLLALSRASDTTATICPDSSQCLCCHDSQGDGRRLSPGYTGNIARPVVGCESCHGPGSGHIAVGGIDMYKVSSSATPSSSAEFNTCTKCHIPFGATPDHYPVSNILTNHAIVTLPADSAFTDTRVNAGASSAVPLYFVKRFDERACTVCHDPHGHGNINSHYARSGHGDTTAPPWTYYDWKLSARAACQRCHTSTGYMNLADKRADYDPANNIFSHLITTTGPRQMEALYCNACHSHDTAKNGKRVYKGDLRNPGAFVPPGYAAGRVSVTEGSAIITGTDTNWTRSIIPVGSRFKLAGDTDTYIVSAPVNTVAQRITLTPIPTTTVTNARYEITTYITPTTPTDRAMTGLAGSFICVSCHSGRYTGEFIKSYPTISGQPFRTFSSHYRAAGGVMFRTAGYEYTGRGYSNPGSYMHDRIGTSSIPGTGTSGPCVACHMNTPAPHLFTAISRVSNAKITALTATTNPVSAITSTICTVCHTGAYERTPGLQNALDDSYAKSLMVLEANLKSKGICYDSSSFFVYSTGACSTTTNYTAWPDKDTLGAAFNMHMLVHLPGAFAHNNIYTKRLLYDSIDWIDNNELNYSVGATISLLSSDPTYSSLVSGAKSFLLRNGVATGNANERP